MKQKPTYKIHSVFPNNDTNNFATLLDVKFHKAEKKKNAEEVRQAQQMFETFHGNVCSANVSVVHVEELG